MIFQLLCVTLFSVVLIQAHPVSNSEKDNEVSTSDVKILTDDENSSEKNELSEVSLSEVNDDQSNGNLTPEQLSQECELLLQKLIFVIYDVRDEDIIDKDGYIDQLMDEMNLMCKDKSIFRRLYDFK